MKKLVVLGIDSRTGSNSMSFNIPVVKGARDNNLLHVEQIQYLII